jgi:hypothetical protein
MQQGKRSLHSFCNNFTNTVALRKLRRSENSAGTRQATTNRIAPDAPVMFVLASLQCGGCLGVIQPQLPQKSKKHQLKQTLAPLP